jgi:GNAT superfamily N-acetyltransferase
VEPVVPHRWPDLEAFFGPRGAYAHCWCTWFRQTSGEFDAGCRDGGAANRALLERITAEARVPGLLGYEQGRPVGWVSVAPRAEFGRILRSPVLRPEDPAEPAVWSVVCFWIPRQHRGRGVATALLAAAVEHARHSGAVVVEGYPVEVTGRRDAAALFTGTVAMFTSAGFRVAFRRRPDRPVVRREVGT